MTKSSGGSELTTGLVLAGASLIFEAVKYFLNKHVESGSADKAQLNALIERAEVFTSLAARVYLSDGKLDDNEKASALGSIHQVAYSIDDKKWKKVGSSQATIYDALERSFQNPLPLSQIAHYAVEKGLVETIYEQAAKAASCDERLKGGEKKFLSDLARSMNVSDDFRKQVDSRYLSTGWFSSKIKS